MSSTAADNHTNTPPKVDATLTLVVMAAGLASRYGREAGAKQLEAIGPNGATLLEYSVFDARRAGFERLVLVVREGSLDIFHEALGARLARQIEVRYAEQRRDPYLDFPRAEPTADPGAAASGRRTKPWGTAHAVLASRAEVPGPFAVVNADDFYGASSFCTLADFLRGSTPATVPTYAVVGFPLGSTLSASGGVNRAFCEIDAEGWLVSIREVLEIEATGAGARYKEAGEWRHVAADQLVSMNMWGFTPEIFAPLEAAFRSFVEFHASDPNAELQLPTALDAMRASAQARVRVLRGSDQWTGLTHAEDKPAVEERLRALVASGAYPADLWA